MESKDHSHSHSPEIGYTMQVVPKVGMFFHSEDHAYNFYNQYAKSVGFSVRKDSSTLSADKEVIRRVLCCSKQGHYKNRGLFTSLRARTRTGCEARIIVKRQGEKFVLMGFNEYHNHELASPSEVHLLRSQWKSEGLEGKAMRNMCRAADGCSSVKKVDDSGNSMVVDCQLSSEKGDNVGTSMIIDSHLPSMLQTNDLAHLALNIVAKGSTSENSVVFTRRLLTQVLEELDTFLKSDYDMTRELVEIRNMNFGEVGEGMHCVDEVGTSIEMRDLKRKKADGSVSGKMKVSLEKGKGKKKVPKIPTGPSDQVSIGAIGTTLLMLQESSMLPKHNHSQACKQANLPKEELVK